MALSTLFTKQHYVLDVLGGVALALVGYLVAFRDYPREAVPAIERRLAPVLAGCAVGIYALIVTGLWLVYLFA